MSTSGATIRDLRRRNRSTLLRRLFFAGPLGRQEVARQTGLSPATVTNVMSVLLAEGVIIEGGVEVFGAGTPPAPLPGHATTRPCSAVHLAGTRATVSAS